MVHGLSFRITFMKRAFSEFHKISYEMTTSVRFCLSYDPFKLDFIIFKVNIKNSSHVAMDVIMTLHVCAKMLCKMWSRDFFDMTLSTE